jgi:formyltetrahydrofolate-dependent phosphoribosylglycinamide formyltransferase
MLNLAVFISGRGTNLQAIHKAILEKRLSAKIALVLSSNPDSEGTKWAEKEGLKTIVCRRSDFKQRGEFVAAMMHHLESSGVDFIVLAGYIRKVPPEVVRRYRWRIINIHPALLPLFGGKGYYGIRVHESVLASGAEYTGVTIHFVEEEYDTGPIIFQFPVKILPGDTPENLAKRVGEIEHKIYPKILQLFAEGKLPHKIFDNFSRLTII